MSFSDSSLERQFFTTKFSLQYVLLVVSQQKAQGADWSEIRTRDLPYNIAKIIATIVTTAPRTNVNKASLRPLYFLAIYSHALSTLLKSSESYQTEKCAKLAINDAQTSLT